MYYYKYINPPEEEFLYASEVELVTGERATGDRRYYVPCDPPTPPTPTSKEIRNKRNSLLLRTDWTQLPDAPLTRQKKEEYAVYRQVLRDITETPPEEIIFPTPPA